MDQFYELLSTAVDVLEALGRGQEPDPIQAAAGGIVLECLSTETFKRSVADYEVAAVACRLYRVACGGYWEFDAADRASVSILVAALRQYMDFLQTNSTLH